MKNLLRDLRQYLHETISVTIDVRRWTKENDLPFFLVDAYEFFEVSFFDKPCLLVVAKGNTVVTPAVIRKNWDQVQKIWKGLSIYVQQAISSYHRKRLIEYNIPFIVPGNQMYLPQLGVDLREHFKRLHAKGRNSLSPATQTVVIYALVRETKESLTPSILAEKLGYACMTMVRAFDELKSAGIGESCRKGKERQWSFSDKKTLWEQAKGYLRSPVKKRVWLKQAEAKVLAGLSALSHFSIISPPVLPVFTISFGTWEEWKQSGVKELAFPEEANFELEIWRYEPNLFAKDGVADPFSVYLSLKETNDERTEAALEEMMRNVVW